jgi:hypothetical protein
MIITEGYNQTMHARALNTWLRDALSKWNGIGDVLSARHGSRCPDPPSRGGRTGQGRAGSGMAESRSLLVLLYQAVALG